MEKSGTWKEASNRSKRRAALLTHVLRFEDLLADDAQCFRLPDDAKEIVIGRADAGPAWRAEGELGLCDNWVSVRHATLRRPAADRPGDADVLADEGSSNGTFINGERVTGRQRLVDGNLVEIGHTLLCYRQTDEPLAELLCGPDAPALGPTLTRCPELAAIVGDLERVAASREPVLLLGETGSGKEVLAAWVHARSGREGELVAVDCGAIPQALFESTFFGHKRGAFTGASDPRIGEIARAHGGTLFLDEVTNMDLACQAKLLRVVETGVVTPLGGADGRQVDVRWIAATNSKAIQDPDRFRPDLLRRLGGYVAKVPPLRRRRDDLGALAAYALREAGATRASITAAAARRLFCDPFAGNVRQLRTALRTARLLAGDGPIDESHLAAVDAAEPGSEAVARSSDTGKKKAPDAARIEEALAATGGNVVRAAQRLEIHPKQLYRFVERFGLSIEKYRST